MENQFGVTSLGFKRKTFEDIIQNMQVKARNLMGNDIDLSDTSPDGMILKNVAYELAEGWKAGEDTYNSGYKDTAEGISLDSVGKYIGLRRKNLKKATTQLVIEGSPGVRIYRGFRGETGGANSKGFLIDDEVIISDNGTVTAEVIAEKPGTSYNVPANSITVISYPIPGVTKIYNPKDVINGRDYEEDPLYRQRYDNSIENGGTATVNAILSAVSKVVNDVRVFDNDKNFTDSQGRPPKSIEVVVSGGEDEVIAQTIFCSSAGGIETYGQIEVVVKDVAGENHKVYFSRAKNKEIYISLTIAKGINYPGDNYIKDLIVNYIGGTKIDGTFIPGLGFNKKVVLSKIEALVGVIDGVDDISAKIGTSKDTMGTSNIETASNEMPQTTPEKVVIHYE